MKYSQEWSLLKTGVESADGREALDDADQLYVLRDFLTTIADIEERTDLNFGAKVRNADILKGATDEVFAELTVEMSTT